MARIRNNNIVPVQALRKRLDQSLQRTNVAKIIINAQLQITKPIGGFCIRNGRSVKNASIIDKPGERARKCNEDLACTSPSRFSCHMLYNIHMYSSSTIKKMVNNRVRLREKKKLIWSAA